MCRYPGLRLERENFIAPAMKILLALSGMLESIVDNKMTVQYRWHYLLWARYLTFPSTFSFENFKKCYMHFCIRIMLTWFFLYVRSYRYYCLPALIETALKIMPCCQVSWRYSSINEFKSCLNFLQAAVWASRKQQSTGGRWLSFLRQ